MATVMAHWQRARSSAAWQGGNTAAIHGPVAPFPPHSPTLAAQPPEVMLSFAVFGDKTDEGDLIVAVTPAWLRIIEELERDPDALLRLTHRQGEELIAGAYREDPDFGLEAEVTLTPRRGDHGVDVIVMRGGRERCAIRILDQVKFYMPGYLVGPDEVREMWGALHTDPRASKAYVTTTSGFTRGCYADFARFRPKIEFRDGLALREWLTRCYRHGG